ncbi:MAG: flippase-like domain-containing protein, partial [Abitibacteriaceae bacterium]|nr:flippase-like domain-containing protein [Abditibacteriaceae bacterium]
LLDCCRLYLIGMFSNLWMPTNIGGDAIRIYLAAPLAGSKAVAASSVLVERLTGFIALLTIGAVGLALRHSGYGSNVSNTGASAAHLITTMTVVLLLFGATLFILQQVAYRLESTAPHNTMVRKWASLHRALDYYAHPEHQGTLAIALALSFLFQSLFVVLNIGLAHAAGLQLPALVFFWLVPLLSIASLLPLGIGGLGVREAAAVALLSGTHAATGTIVAWSLLWQATVWLASLPGALLSVGLKSNLWQRMKAEILS